MTAKKKGSQGSQGSRGEVRAKARVTRDEIQRIARLAELAVNEQTTAELEVQLSRILDYVAQLGELPTDGAADGEAGGVRLRPDEPGRADPLARAPADWAAAFKGGLFVVPRLGELDTGATP